MLLTYNDYHFIYTSMCRKFGKTIFRNLPRLMFNYLKDNPEKLDLYLNVNIKDLFVKVNQEYQKDNNIELVPTIIKIVEDVS